MTNLSGANLNNGTAVGPQGESRDSPSRFPKYPEYKNSGHEWVGEIPSHWYVYRSKNIFSERNVKALESDEQLTASQKYGVIPQRLFSELEGQKVMQVILGRDILKKAEVNDFVISMRSFQGGLEFCSYSGAVSSAYVPLYANREIDNRFFKHLFKSVSFISALQNTSNLVRDGQALRYNNFVQLSLPFPSLNEQRTIGAFLDHETARIDALIEEQQRLIELLKEKRQAVISHAVTKGLDPTVPMKDSGVEWLGEVPAHWELKKLRHIGHARNGLTYSPEDVVDFSDSATLVLRSSNIQKARISLEDNVYVEKRIPEALRVREGDLLICSRNGSRALIGKNALIPKELDGQSFGAFMMVFRSGVNEFIYWVLNSPIFDYQSSTFLTATINQLTNENLGGMLAPFPPSAEQAEIVLFLTEKSQEIDILISEVQGGVELLYERRSALISAAVTGKIDVRGWQPPTNTQAPELAVAEAV